ncbi:DUF6957 family protein [Pseudomonas amygdali]|uniref:DUF6957 family protein n=1 Tax=Pseudomonas amygdali TaxID=47877 RepID=UPI000F3C7C3A|nr:hypothetical protein [Pseudomonas amygdali]RMU96718.1 hypothetical protein ALP18_200365 [Pseudomonas amygdali pv. myricae]
MKFIPTFEMIALKGQPVVGASLPSASAILETLYAACKPWCAFSSWVLIDVVSADHAMPLPKPKPKPIIPMVMYAHHVQIDSSHRLRDGDSVMSGFATSYSQDGIFETRSTIYILLGRGLRKSADACTARAAQLRPLGISDIYFG